MDAVFGGGPTYASPVGTFYAAGKWLYGTPEVSAPLYHILFGGAPGVEGMYSINLGFRAQDFQFRAMYVATSPDIVLANWIADAFNLVGPKDLTLGSATLKRCFIEPQISRCTEIEKIVVDGSNILYMMYAIIKMSSKGSAS